MNKIVNNFLLAGDKLMPEMHISQPGFTYSTSGPITENKERIQQFKENGDSRFIYQNERDKACFQHDRTYRNFEDLTRRSAFDKILHNNIAKNTKYDGYRGGFG